VFAKKQKTKMLPGIVFDTGQSPFSKNEKYHLFNVFVTWYTPRAQQGISSLSGLIPVELDLPP